MESKCSTIPPRDSHRSFWKTLGLTAALVVILTSTRAESQDGNCAPREIVLEKLFGQFGESRKSIGIDSRNIVAEVFASDETGTWTITLTGPYGITCVVGSGEAFENTNDVLQAKKPAFKPDPIRARGMPRPL